MKIYAVIFEENWVPGDEAGDIKRTLGLYSDRTVAIDAAITAISEAANELKSRSQDDYSCVPEDFKPEYHRHLYELANESRTDVSYLNFDGDMWGNVQLIRISEFFFEEKSQKMFIR